MNIAVFVIHARWRAGRPGSPSTAPPSSDASASISSGTDGRGSGSCPETTIICAAKSRIAPTENRATPGDGFQPWESTRAVVEPTMMIEVTTISS